MRPQPFCLSALIACAIAAFSGVVDAQTAPPTVLLTTTISQPTANVGDILTVTVSAQVNNGLASNGILSYDLDLFTLDTAHLKILGVASLLPPTSTFSAGTPDAGSGALWGISGVFDAPGVAVNTSVPLFTLQVQALAATVPGSPASVSAGLSVYPGGVGHPFQLNGIGDYNPSPENFSIDTSQAIATVSIAAVPEPATLAVVGLGVMFLLNRRRTQAS